MNAQLKAILANLDSAEKAGARSNVGAAIICLHYERLDSARKQLHIACLKEGNNEQIRRAAELLDEYIASLPPPLWKRFLRFLGSK